MWEPERRPSGTSYLPARTSRARNALHAALSRGWPPSGPASRGSVVQTRDALIRGIAQVAAATRPNGSSRSRQPLVTRDVSGPRPILVEQTTARSTAYLGRAARPAGLRWTAAGYL